MLIRPTELADADQIAALLQALRPYHVVSAEGIRRRLEKIRTDERAADWVVENDEVVLGWARVGPARFESTPGAFEAAALVRPEYRRQGIGSSLADLIKDHAIAQQAARLQSMVDTEDLGFALARGGAAGNVNQVAGLQLDALPEQPALPAGTSVVPLTALDPQDVHPLFAETVLQIPGFADMDVSYGNFLTTTWDVATGNSHELGAAAVVDGTVVAVTMVVQGNDTLWTNLTATSTAHRGQGLAKLVKWFSLKWAADAGCTTAYTANSTQNAPVLAVNEWFGYRPAASSTTVTWCADTDL